MKIFNFCFKNIKIRGLFNGGFMKYNLLIFILIFSITANADEGMFTFDNPPLKIIKEKYGFELTDEWLKNAMLSCVRFNNGGSGSFVSPDGLVLTNHHIGFDCIQKISTPEKDYIKTGFIAIERNDELPCPDLEINVLISMEDVTQRVLNSVKDAKREAEKGKLRKKEIAKIEKECSEKTALRCNVITLYGGGEYVLYKYRKHTDVRLVLAPEQQIAFYGGDPDNFTYPRFDLDFAFFRVYENGMPYNSPHYFKWSKGGATEGELVFVIGNPGTTARLMSVSQVEFEKNVRTPNRLRSFNKVLKVLKEYASKSEENARQTKESIFMYENAIKFYKGLDEGLKDGSLIEKKKKDEEDFLKLLKKYPQLYSEVKNAFKKISQAQKEHQKFHVEKYIVETSMVGRSELLRRAIQIIQMIPEKKKTNEERLEEYRDSNLHSLELELYSTAPIYKGVEEINLLNSIDETLEILGKDHPFILTILNGRSPSMIAKEAVLETKLYDVSERKKLVSEGEKMSIEEWNKKIKEHNDPMIQLALKIDPYLRELKKRYEDKVEAIEKTEGQKIAIARFKIYGKDKPPDATFTLRLAFGVVKGYEAEGSVVPYKTNFYGLYGRWASFEGNPPFDLPPRYIEKKEKLDLSTPLNFVSTADIVGGNSGSPVINKNGEIIGLIFDGNIQSHILRYFYTEEKARAVAVHSSGIIESVKKVYEAKKIIEELGIKITNPK